MKKLLILLFLLIALSSTFVIASSSCSGTAAACDTFENATCTQQAGCSVGELACEGDATACTSMVEVDTCAAQSGCDWEYSADYTAGNIADVTVDSLVGVGATIFLFASVIGLILLWKWVRKNR